jgi:hypothetical protein
LNGTNSSTNDIEGPPRVKGWCRDHRFLATLAVSSHDKRGSANAYEHQGNSFKNPPERSAGDRKALVVMIVAVDHDVRARVIQNVPQSSQARAGDKVLTGTIRREPHSLRLSPPADPIMQPLYFGRNGSAVVRNLHGGAIYHFHGSTYSVDEQYSGEGCSTERPKTLPGAWGVLLLSFRTASERARTFPSGVLSSQVCPYCYNTGYSSPGTRCSYCRGVRDHAWAVSVTGE